MDRQIPYAQRMRRVQEVIQEVEYKYYFVISFSIFRDNICLLNNREILFRTLIFSKINFFWFTRSWPCQNARTQ